jgi:hypothetical protein
MSSTHWLQKHPSSNKKAWKTDMGINYLPNHFSSPKELLKFFLESNEDQLFITVALKNVLLLLISFRKRV